MTIYFWQDGCTFRDHVIKPSSAHGHTSPTASSHKEQVYSILCKLRETVCAETLRSLAKKDDSTSNSNLTRDSGPASPLQQALNEVYFLQSEVREPRLPPKSSGEVPVNQSSHHRDVSRGRSSDSLQLSSSSQAVNQQPPQPSTRHAAHAQRTGSIARQMSRDSQQQSHDLVELEEDDDYVHHPTPVLVQRSRSKRARHVS